jgi:L-gulonate 3-dehydrogenase
LKAIAVIGCGPIGQGWAQLFARRGFEVRLFDVSKSAAARAQQFIKSSLVDLEREGGDVSPGQSVTRISVAGTLVEAVAGVTYVQECVPEDVSAKAQTFADLGALTDRSVILASSCSSLLPDTFLDRPRFRERCIVAHPFSPPNLIPLVELVMSSWTSEPTLQKARDLLTGLGRRPVVLRKAVPGYVVNRLQAAVIAEALALVRDGVISPEDLDASMKHGLGRRWAFMGPFETMDLNSAGGFAEYVNKFYRDGYRAICDDLKTREPWAPDAIAQVEQWRRAELPDEQALLSRRRWRDRMLVHVARLVTGAENR